MAQDIRVRFAPSPTGYLHVGNARTALFNYLYARATGGKFIVRIEDTDQKRSTQDAVNKAIESLKWMGLEWDEGPDTTDQFGPYFQSKRLDIYNKYCNKLLKDGKAYRCFCTEEELNNKRKENESNNQSTIYDNTCRDLSADIIKKNIDNNLPYSIRIKNSDQDITFNDMVRGEITVNTNLVGDFIIVRADGYPTYNFAVVIDDALMKITHVIRGDDHISNTPRQILLYMILGFDIPFFGHISTILGSDKQKLSKRHGAASILEFKEAGYLSDPFINYLALLGWSAPDQTDIISRDRLKTIFSGDRFNKSPAVFDYAKLDYINGQYIRELDSETAFTHFKPFIVKAGFLNEESSENDIIRIKKIIEIVRSYCKKLSDIPQYISVFEKEDFKIDTSLLDMINSQDSKNLFSLIIRILKQNTGDITPEEFSEIVKQAKEELNIKGKMFFMPFRIALTGQEHGVELHFIFEILGREKIIHRLQKHL